MTSLLEKEKPSTIYGDEGDELVALREENRLLRIENATLHKWIEQQNEFVERLASAARKGKT